MNPYQKSAILVVRLCGIGMTTIGLMAVLHVAYSLKTATIDPATHVRGELGVIWLIFGTVVLAVSRILGRWIGSDLG